MKSMLYLIFFLLIISLFLVSCSSSLKLTEVRFGSMDSGIFSETLTSEKDTLIVVSASGLKLKSGKIDSVIDVDVKETGEKIEYEKLRGVSTQGNSIDSIFIPLNQGLPLKPGTYTITITVHDYNTLSSKVSQSYEIEIG
jgi:hypothetical protein